MTILESSAEIDVLRAAFGRTRRLTEALAEPLSGEDQTVQSMPDTSPTKWHRAHTTWFFETFLLAPYLDDYQAFDPHFNYLFNSYYEAVGARHPRPDRGMVTRPGIAEIAAYRRHVDEAMDRLMADVATGQSPDAEQRRSELATLVRLGINHEQQHQELLLMDIKHVLANNIYGAGYAPASDTHRSSAADPGPANWIHFEGGIVDIGLTADSDGFRFDNEEPRHQALVHPFKLADRLVTAGEWLEFMADGGYETASLWLSDGWHRSNSEGWNSPLYWQRDDDDQWIVHTLRGPTAPSMSTSRSATCLSMKPMPLPPGPGLGCLPNSNGSMRLPFPSPEGRLVKGRCSISQRLPMALRRPMPSTRRRQPPPTVSSYFVSSSATVGNGRARPTARTRATTPPTVPLANTTASS